MDVDLLRILGDCFVQSKQDVASKARTSWVRFKTWSCLFLWVFFMCLFLKKNSGFLGLLEIELVTGFIGLFLRFISCFSGFDGVDLDLGFAGDWFISWI